MSSNKIYKDLADRITACNQAIEILNTIEAKGDLAHSKLIIVYGELAAIKELSQREIERGKAYESDNPTLAVTDTNGLGSFISAHIKQIDNE